MKIIMNNVNSSLEAEHAFIAVKEAIKDKIREGRINFELYTFTNSKTFAVCKNKDSYTVYAHGKE